MIDYKYFPSNPEGSIRENVYAVFLRNEIQTAVSRPVLHAIFSDAVSSKVLSTLQSLRGITATLITLIYSKLID